MASIATASMGSKPKLVVVDGDGDGLVAQQRLWSKECAPDLVPLDNDAGDAEAQ